MSSALIVTAKVLFTAYKAELNCKTPQTQIVSWRREEMFQLRRICLDLLNFYFLDFYNWTIEKHQDTISNICLTLLQMTFKFFLDTIYSHNHVWATNFVYFLGSNQLQFSLLGHQILPKLLHVSQNLNSQVLTVTFWLLGKKICDGYLSNWFKISVTKEQRVVSHTRKFKF